MEDQLLTAARLIENDFLRQFAGGFERSGNQINNLLESDAELIRLNDDIILAITTDNIVEEVQKGLYTDPEHIGWMTVIVNLSDLAAVGARPLGILLNITLSPNTGDEFLDRLQRGITKACKEYNICVFGGDTNSGNEFQIGGVGVGIIDDGGPVLTRKGAGPGDLLFTTEYFGEGGYYAFNRYFGENKDSGQFYPQARIEQGKVIRKFGSACIDTSDGFFAAASNLMEVNGWGFRLISELESIVNPGILESLHKAGLPPWYMLAGPHGEFELLFTVRGHNLAMFVEAAKTINWSPRLIGEVITDPFIFFEIKGRNLRCKPEEIANLYYLCKGDVHEYIQRLNVIHKSWNL